MLIEEHFDQVIKHIYSLKMAVSATNAAKSLLTSKGLTPAMFLRPFFKSGNRQAQFTLIDVEDYGKPTEKQVQERTRQVLAASVVNAKAINKESFKTRAEVQDHINNLGFLWTLEASKVYLQSTCYDYDISMIDQPLGVIHILCVGDDSEFNKVQEQTNSLKKQAYRLNLNQYITVQTMVIVLVDIQNGQSIEEALHFSQTLKKVHKIFGNWICRLEVNTPDAEDLQVWANHRRNSYAYKIQQKQSEIVRLISKTAFQKIMKTSKEFENKVRENIKARMEHLNKQFKQASKVTNKIFGAFNNITVEKDKYSPAQSEMRELADLSFLHGQYKKAYEVYKELLGKFQNRNRNIYTSILQMQSHCHVYGKIYQTNVKGDAYQYVEKQAKAILQNPNFLLKYSIFLVYSLYVLKVFKKDFIKEVFYPRLKPRLRTDTAAVSLIAFILEEQYSTFHLHFTPVIEYRNYASSLLKVGIHFLDAKLMNNAYRCFLILENIYRGTFTVIELFIFTYLAKMCLQQKNFALCANSLKKGWAIIHNRINDEKFNQWSKNYERILVGLEQAGGIEYLKKEGLNRTYANVLGVEISTEDDYHDEKLPRINPNIARIDTQTTETWTDMGGEFFGRDNIARNNNASYYRRLISYDAQNIEKKYLAFRFKPIGLKTNLAQKHSRVCFVDERIRIHVWLQNPLNQQVDIAKCSLTFNMSEDKYTCQPPSYSFKLKPNQQRVLDYVVIPKTPGILQLTEINWLFNKIANSYKIPMYQQGEQYNFYYKMNVKEPVGMLRIQPKINNRRFFVGQLLKWSVSLHNDGTERIEEVSIISSDERLNGFRMVQSAIPIEPGKHIDIPFNSRIYSQKCQNLKLLFIYKTKETIRMKRLIVKLQPEAIMDIQDIKCQKISAHMHILSFNIAKKTENRPVNLLEDTNNSLEVDKIIFGNGFKIIKNETTQSKDTIFYIVFLQKNPHAIKDSQTYGASPLVESDYEVFLEMDEKQRRLEWLNYENKYYPYDHVDRMNMVILFRYEGRPGICHPQKIATNPKLLKILEKTSRIEEYLLPFNFRIRYQALVQHNFNKEPILAVPVEILIKNIFTQKDMHLTIEMFDEENSQGHWQGITQLELHLPKNQQKSFNVDFVVTQPGLYDLSRIRYKLHRNKNKDPTVIVHSIYEKIYLEVSSQKNFLKSGKVEKHDLLL